MTQARISLAITAALVTAGIIGLSASERTHAGAAPDLGLFRDLMASSSAVYFAAHHDPPGVRQRVIAPEESGVESYAGYAAADGRVAISYRGMGHMVWWYWDGHVMHEDGEPLDRRAHPAILGRKIADVIDEARAGLPNHALVAEDPPNTIVAPDMRWGRLVPADGVDPVSVYVGVWTRDGLPHQLVLVGDPIAATFGGGLRVQLELAFDVPVPIGTFQKSRTYDICPPLGWWGMPCRPPHEDPDAPVRGRNERIPPSRPASDYERGGRCAAFPEQARPPDRVIPGC